MDELDIRREHVICLGTSAGRVGALLIGLEIGAGAPFKEFLQEQFATIDFLDV